MFDNKYLYSVTRTRVLETKLLDRTKIERMVDAKSAEEVIKVLSETDYAGSVSEMDDIQEYEDVLAKEIVKTYAYIAQVSPEPELTNIFLYRYDVHNLKVLLKSLLLQEDNDFLLTHIGTIPVSKLKEMVKERSFKELNPHISKGVTEILESMENNPDPQLIDIVLDRSLYQAIYSIVKKRGNEFLQDFISAQIDLINIKSFIRIKTIGYGRDYLSKVMLENGSLNIDFFARYFDEPFETLAEKLWNSPYYNVVQEGIESFLKTRTLTKYEKLADDFVFNMAKKGKYVAFGIEPLVGYIMAKENEAKIIRMIMVGKINQIPNDLIRERLRDVYV